MEYFWHLPGKVGTGVGYETGLDELACLGLLCRACVHIYIAVIESKIVQALLWTLILLAVGDSALRLSATTVWRDML